MSAVSLAACSALVMFSACGGSSAAAEQTLRFSAIPDTNTTELKEKYDQVATYLSSELGVTVEFVPSSDYSASVEAFKNGDIQLAWFGGLTGVQARAAVEGARAIAQGAADPQFKSYFIANASTGIEASDDFPMALRGRSFTFGSPDSTSGRLMPEHFIRTNTSESPVEFFGKENSYSGSHDKTALLVAEGSFEAGALNYKTYDQMVADGKLDPAVCKIVWTTPPYPDYNWTAHPDLETRLGAGFIDRLQSALIGMQDPALLAAMSRPDGIIKAENADFAPIAELATELGFLR